MPCGKVTRTSCGWCGAAIRTKCFDPYCNGQYGCVQIPHYYCDNSHMSFHMEDQSLGIKPPLHNQLIKISVSSEPCEHCKREDEWGICPMHHYVSTHRRGGNGYGYAGLPTAQKPLENVVIRLTPEQVLERNVYICERLEQGARKADIAAEVGLSYGRICELAKQLAWAIN